MKLQLAQTEGWNTFTAYGEDYVSVNAVRHQDNLIVLPYQLIEKWTPASFSTLSRADFDFLATLDAEIILLGTGKLLRFPSPELMQSLMQARKGIEVMDTQAACRTFNVLAGEKRKVAAALLFS
jgi:uncharacterized protein